MKDQLIIALHTGSEDNTVCYHEKLEIYKSDEAGRKVGEAIKHVSMGDIWGFEYPRNIFIGGAIYKVRRRYFVCRTTRMSVHLFEIDITQL